MGQEGRKDGWILLLSGQKTKPWLVPSPCNTSHGIRSSQGECPYLGSPGFPFSTRQCWQHSQRGTKGAAHLGPFQATPHCLCPEKKAPWITDSGSSVVFRKWKRQGGAQDEPGSSQLSCAGGGARDTQHSSAHRRDSQHLPWEPPIH